MSVILRVDEKVGHVISLLGENYSDKEFLDKFIEIYPDDYKKCWRRFNEEEAHTKPGKRHPMQHPDKHIKNALKSYLSRKKDMKINLIKFLMGLVAFLIFAPQAHAADFEVDGIYYKILSSYDYEVEVTYKYSGSSNNRDTYKGDVKIPKKIIYNSKTYTVTALGSSAFSGCSGLTSLTIPTSVTKIGQYTFSGCSGLTSLTIPSSVTSIWYDAFVGCGSLKGIEVDAGNSAFASQDGVLYTKNLATLRCYPQGKAGSFTVPNSVTKIDWYAFSYCKDMTSITIPNSVITIEPYAFEGCSGLTSLTIPNSVTIIGWSAFEGCSGLNSLTIPNSVTIIDSFAFMGCSNLTSMNIPNSVTKIGSEAFYDCGSLREIYCHWEVPLKYSERFSDEVLKEAILYVPKGCVSAYEKVDPWRNFWNIEEANYSGITETSVDGLHISVTDGVINIDCVGSETLVEVFDIAGKAVYRGYGHTVTGLSNGIYIVKVGSQTRKIRI